MENNVQKFKDLVKKQIEKNKLRRLWFDKFCDFIRTTYPLDKYPNGVSIGKRVENKLTEFFGENVVRLYAGIVTYHFEVIGTDVTFDVCYVPKSFPTPNAGFLLLSEVERQNLGMIAGSDGMAQNEKMLTELEKESPNIENLIEEYDKIMMKIIGFNSKVSNVYPFSLLSIDIRQK